MMLLVNMLGPLQAHDEDIGVTPTAPKPRQVLGLLAMRAGRGVGVSDLCEELWEENPPPSATTTIQTYIRTIRRAFGADTTQSAATDRAKSMLRTGRGGYCLELAPGALDVDVFEDRVGRAQEARAGGELATAGRLLGAALDVWRGPVLADVPTGPLLRAQIARLDECRLAALEQRIEIDLLLRRERTVIAELAELNARYPLHERFCAHLMLALYRVGRQSEALQAFARLRSALVEELAVEPSPRLQRDLQAILRSEVESEIEAPRRAAVGRVA